MKLTDYLLPSLAPRLRTLAALALFGLLFGLLGMGEIVEDGLRVLRNRAQPVAASGDIVVFGIDDKSQRELGNWPWPRARQAELVNRLAAAGPKQILLDFMYDYPSNPGDDARLAQAIDRAGNVVLPIRHRSGARKGETEVARPLPMFARHARQGTISIKYNYQSSVWQLPYTGGAEANHVPSFAARLAGVDPGKNDGEFTIDYRTRLESIPYASASLAFSSPAELARLVRGKQVIVGVSSPNIGDLYFIPGDSRRGGVFVHALGGETLKRGIPRELGWWPALLAALLVSAVVLRHSRMRLQGSLIGGASLILLLLPMAAEARLIFFDITPALAVLVATGVTLARRRYRASGFVNSSTGLPNLNALKAQRLGRDRALIVARVLNYAQLGAALNDSDERALVGQIVGRLGVGNKATTIYQGDEGIFAWLAEPGIAVGHHVEALHALFRSPARIGATSYDLALSFGVEIGSSRTMANRLGSALVAADEAAVEGLKWKYHDPERFLDENWRLSLLAQLDQAIDQGEVWVAFQPQLDLASGRIRGAEALARWTHAEKGPISPAEFIHAAEQHGRIDRLTLYMLDRAIAAAAAINRSGIDFDIAVNLSARTLARRTLCREVGDLLEQHRLAPERLTLELTETAALASDGSDLDPLVRLRDLGVRISIDDYGTGLSTLDYLKKVPAAEIKIDQSFIKAMRDNRSDNIMVQSTISLAHSLGRTVVAEGVEDRETLDTLIAMKCDAAQGFMIGRPVSYEGLKRRLSLAAKGRAA